MGSDADTDLALLDVPDADLRFQPLARERRRVGQPVVAVGATEGHATARASTSCPASTCSSTPNGSVLAGLLGAGLTRTPDTSGGGLFNTNGELVGILTSPPGVADGLAVPIGIADDVRDQIESSGKVTHGWLGLAAEDAAATVPGGPRSRSSSSSPAAAAELEVGDVITRAGGQWSAAVDDLIAEWRAHRPATQDHLRPSGPCHRAADDGTRSPARRRRAARAAVATAPALG